MAVESTRTARADDLPRCATLIETALSAALHMRGGPRLLDEMGAGDSCRTRGRQLVESWARSPEHHLVAGTFLDAVVGLAVGHAVGAVGVLDCCYVEPEARGVGVGTAMGEALLAWFSERGCTEVDALALPGDRSTKQLLEALGLSARLLVLHRRLP